mgnify:CR=1 FL=1
MARKVAIKQNEPPAEEVSTEVIANAIVSISEGIERLRAGRLNDRALLLLIQHAASVKLPARDIKAVLDGIQGLREAYLK